MKKFWKYIVVMVVQCVNIIHATGSHTYKGYNVKIFVIYLSLQNIINKRCSYPNLCCYIAGRIKVRDELEIVNHPTLK